MRKKQKRKKIRDTFTSGGIGLQVGAAKKSLHFWISIFAKFCGQNITLCLFVHLFLLHVIVDEKKVKSKK